MKVAFGISTHRSEGLLGCVHIDVWVPIETASLENRQYFVSFIDNFSRRCWVYHMRQMFEALDMLVK